jgi:hypothetical protein
MNVEPLKFFIEGRDALKAGNKAEAEKLFAKALGLPDCTEYMKLNLDQLVNIDEQTSEAMLVLLVNKITRRVNYG